MKGLDIYKKAQAATAHTDLRQVESDALLKVARQMESAYGGPSGPLFEALLRNIQLWNIFAQECGAAGNPLPQALKTQIASLAAWAISQSEKAIAHEAGVESLVEINRMVAKGLATKSGEPLIGVLPEIGVEQA
jgi:flagellar protein FlaF